MCTWGLHYCFVDKRALRVAYVCIRREYGRQAPFPVPCLAIRGHPPEKAKVMYLSRMKLDTCCQTRSGSMATSRRCAQEITLSAVASCGSFNAQMVGVGSRAASVHVHTGRLRLLYMQST